MDQPLIRKVFAEQLTAVESYIARSEMAVSAQIDRVHTREAARGGKDWGR